MHNLDYFNTFFVFEDKNLDTNDIISIITGIAEGIIIQRTEIWLFH
jgi:hypothetical protein